MSTTLLWFRRDLRLNDNPALCAALQRGGNVIPVFIDETDDGLAWYHGSASRWWLHHSLHALGSELADRGSRLIIRRGPSEAALRQLAAETSATHLFWNRIYEPGPIARDAHLKDALRQAGLDVRSFNSALLYEPWNVATQKQEPYRVFTPYWRALRRLDFAPPVAQANAPIPAAVPPALTSLAVEDLDLLPRIPWDHGLRAAWTPGERGAQRALDAFIDVGLASYAEDRDRPDRSGTSRLSPHLHFGEIGPRQIVAGLIQAELLRAESGITPQIDAFLREIGWREFAHHLLYHFPETADVPLDRRFVRFPWVEEPGDALVRWQQGRTGIPLIDAGMRELWHTGWMHNRVRMAVASLLTKNLRIAWLAGARWFWDTLVDADLANNTLGWQWSAGCGADAAPYFRILNPVLQARRFDPQGAYVRRWVPELAGLSDEHIHAPWAADRAHLTAAGIELGRTYPNPLVDLRESREQALAAFSAMKSAN